MLCMIAVETDRAVSLLEVCNKSSPKGTDLHPQYWYIAHNEYSWRVDRVIGMSVKRLSEIFNISDIIAIIAHSRHRISCDV